MNLSAERQFHDAYYATCGAPQPGAPDAVSAEYRRRALNPSPRPLDYWEYVFYLLGDLRGKRVLDIGCGGGWISRLLAAKGARLTACDLSIEGCRRTREKLNVEGSGHVSVQDAHHMALADCSFDVVVSTGVLHHLDLALAAEEIRRVLKPGGMLVFQEPMRYGPLMWAIRTLWLRLHGQPEDARTENEESLTDAHLGRLFEIFREGKIRKFNLLAKTNKLGNRFGLFARSLRWADLILLSAVPPLRRHCTCAVGIFRR